MSESRGFPLGSLSLRVAAAALARGRGLGCSVFGAWVGKVGVGRCSGGLEGDQHEKLKLQLASPYSNGSFLVYFHDIPYVLQVV